MTIAVSAGVVTLSRSAQPPDKALLAARAALEKQAEDVVVMDVRALSTVTDFFVIGTAGSSRQLVAVKEHIEAQFAQRGYAVWHVEGTPAPMGSWQGADRAPQWLLLDCGDVVVHLLDEHARALYQLERLWGDAPRIPLTAGA